MKEHTNATRTFNARYGSVFRPRIYYLDSEAERVELTQFLSEHPDCWIHDRIEAQLYEWVKVQHPEFLAQPEKLEALAKESLAQIDESYGVMVYYPWLNGVVRLVPEDVFIALRTNRNQQKITQDEQQQLQSKAVGVVGLSVGNAVAVTLAMERVCGTLKLADFDELELSNLNRLRGGVHQTGISKAVLAARQIAEIDPFLQVEIYEEGLTSENQDDFLQGSAPLDLVVEVCDSLPVKFDLRHGCRTKGIPVIMDTNDRGLIDVERFDREPDRPLFHGRVQDWEHRNLAELTGPERLALVEAIVGKETFSDRLRISMDQIGKSLTSWPQLASGVMLGGAVTTDVCRRILLDQFTASGRYYVDFDELVQ